MIKQFGTKTPNGYNMTDGGDGCIGLKKTPEQLANHSKKMIASWERKTPEERKEISKNISESCKKKWKDPAQVERVKAEMREVWRKRKAGLLPMPKRNKSTLST